MIATYYFFNSISSDKSCYLCIHSLLRCSLDYGSKEIELYNKRTIQ